MSQNPPQPNTAVPAFSTNPQSYRRLSYATVAAGSGSANPSRFNTLAASQSSITNPIPIPQQQPQPTRQRSQSSLRSMEIDERSGSGTWQRPTSSWSNDLGRTDGKMGCTLHDDHLPFFTPSYLRRSRHVRKLQIAWEEHMAELRETMRLTPAPAPSISRSSSNANLNKMLVPHVHRGVVQDVIERITPPAEEDKTHPLPSKFNEHDRMSGLEILADGSEVRFSGVTKTQDEAASVRANHPMPRECGLYYYEITILSRGKDAFIGIGFSGKKVNLSRLPGWEADSWAYHGDDGYSFSSTQSGKAYGPKFSSQDVIGCGLNFRTGNAFFTKNGVYLGVAFSNIKSERLYPSVGMKKPGDHIRINFGRHPFVFDIDGMMAQERQSVMNDIRKAESHSLHPPDDENTLLHNLIGQYLAHEGYIETARALARDIHDRQQSLPNGSGSSSFQLPGAEDDVHAANRQKIRKSILDGDIDKALKYTHCFYPNVLKDERNRDINFRLQCRKFIEMMRRYTDLSAAATSSTISKSVDSLGSNGHVDGGIEFQSEIERQEPADTQMELDDQLHRETSQDQEASLPPEDIDMDASTELPSKASFMRLDDLLAQAFAYGQQLRSTYGSDPRPQIKKQLVDMFAIMAYPDPTESVVAQLFDPQRRVQIAEDLNGAILVSLGKPSSAALEKLSAQTEALLDEVAGKTGGAAAFVSVQQDILQA